MAQRSDASTSLYNRAYLLGKENRNRVLGLDEVVRYGVDSFADPDYVTLYGLRPPEWYARGVRLLARTVVECTRDALAQRIACDVAAVADAARGVVETVVVDPFAGSANTLYWLARRTAADRAVGHEIDERVFQTTRRNLSIIGFGAEFARVGYEIGLRALSVAEAGLLVVFLAPPWGDALDEVAGLDLRRTAPPVVDIVDILARTFTSRRVVFAVQVHETALPAAIDEVRSRAQWSALKLYDINAAGQNHGVLVGTLGWSV